VTFRVVAIARDDEVARLYLLSDERQRMKFFNKIDLLSGPAKPSDMGPEVDAIRKEVERHIKKEKIKELSTPWFAQTADLSDLYNSVYSVLSDSVHANVRDLDSVLERNEAGEIVGLQRYEPETEEMDKLLLVACDMVLKSLEAVSPLAALREEFEKQFSLNEDV
jgi:hypothetical protein